MALCMVVVKWYIFMVLLYLTAAWPDHHITVSSSGHDNTTCLTNYSIPCLTLEYVFKNSLNSSTLLEITEGTYSLDNIYHIKDKGDILIVGEQDKVAIKCNASALNVSGLAWFSSHNITFQSLMIDGCGHLIHTSPLQSINDTIYKFTTGLSFVYCRDLEFYNITFRNNRGLAVTLYDSGGKVNFTGSNFSGNGASNITLINIDSNVQRSGGGVMIHLTKFGYFPPFNDTSHRQFSNNSQYYFKNTTFQKNSYHKSSTKEVPSPFGWGGGLTIIVGGVAKNNSFFVESSHFEGNEAIWGGGLFAEFHDSAGGNFLSLSDNVFKMNFARYAGGAIRTGNSIIEKNSNVRVEENKVELLRNHFDTNIATLGGALSHYGWTYHQKNANDYRHLSLKECIFERNIATLGSSIAVNLNDGNNWLEIGSQLPYIVHLIDCTFNNNFAFSINKTVLGMGVVYSSRVPLVLKGNNNFTRNNNTALLLDNAPLKVINETLFLENVGYVGGAMAFYGEAKLVLTKNSRLLFKRNEALQKGGAIYIRTPGPDIAPFTTTELRRYQCILQYEDDDGKMIDIEHVEKWQTKLEFLDNKAPELYGSSLYATTIQSCYREGETSTDNKAFEWENIISYSGCIEDEISTNPVAIDFNPDDWLRAPYERFDAFVHLRDEKNNTVSGIAKIDIIPSENDHYPKLEPESSLFLVQADKKGNFTKSLVAGLRIKGRVNQNFTLKISTFDGQVVQVSSSMKLKGCNEGFEQIDDHPFKCTCMKNTDRYHEGIYNCSGDGRSVNLKTGQWGGFVPNGSDSKVFVTYPCPEHYCNFDTKKAFFTYNNNTICSSHRTDVLCGKCKSDYTLSLGNEKCISNVECKKKGYGITWLLPVFFVAVPIVVLILLRLDFDIFTPYLGSWLYFYQVLPYIVQQTEHFDIIMQGVLMLASWRIPGAHLTCFMRNLDNIKKLFFNYLFPLYVLFVVVAIAKITRWCGFRCFGRSNVFNAISTIVVFGYTDLTLISFSVFRWPSIGPNLRVLYVQGSVTNIKVHHNPLYYFLLVLAIIVTLFFVIAVPLTLLFKPFLVKRVRFMANFRNLLNILQGCYRDEWICFSAYYFILRIAILFLTSIVFSAPGPSQRWWIDLILIVSLVIFAYIKPYKTDEDSSVRWLNIVDTFILMLLCLLSQINSVLNSEAASTPKGNNTWKRSLQVGSWLPMLYLLILVVLAIRKKYAAMRRQRGYQNIEEVSTTGGTDDGGTGTGTGETSLTSRSFNHDT